LMVDWMSATSAVTRLAAACPVSASARPGAASASATSPIPPARNDRRSAPGSDGPGHVVDGDGEGVEERVIEEIQVV